MFLLSFILWLIPILEEYYSMLISESILANFFSGFFTATIFIPGIIILTNLFPGVFTAAGITEPPLRGTRGAIIPPQVWIISLSYNQSSDNSIIFFI